MLAAAPAERVRLVGVSAQATGQDRGRADRSDRAGRLRGEPARSADACSSICGTSSVADVANAGQRAGSGRRRHARAGHRGRRQRRRARARGARVARRVYGQRCGASRERDPPSSSNRERAASRRRAASPRGAPPALASTPRRAPRRRQPPVERRAATQLEKVRASHTRHRDDVTLAGNGRLTPSSLTESRRSAAPARARFPERVAAAAASRTGVDGAFVKQVRVALNSREPLVTRVVMEIRRRRDLSRRAHRPRRPRPRGRVRSPQGRRHDHGGAAGSAAAAPRRGGRQGRRQLRWRRRSPTPRRSRRGDPMIGARRPTRRRRRQPPARRRRARSPRRAGTAAARRPAPGRSRRRPPAPRRQPPPPPAPPTAGPRSQFDVPGTGQKQYIGHPINFDFEDADLRAVLRVFADESGLNMIIDPQVQGTRQRPAERRAVGPGARSDPALEQARLHRRGHHHPHRAAGGARRRAGGAAEAGRSEGARRRARVQTFPLSYAKADSARAAAARSRRSRRAARSRSTRAPTRSSSPTCPIACRRRSR